MTHKQAAERILELDKKLTKALDLGVQIVYHDMPGHYIAETRTLAPQVAKALLEAIDLLKKYARLPGQKGYLWTVEQFLREVEK